MLVSAALTIPSAYAVELNMFGHLISTPTCKIDNDKIIQVDFGSAVQVEKVDGSYLKKVVPYTITCSDSSVSLSMYLTLVSANVATYDTAAVQTSTTDLAVRMELAGAAFKINTPVKITGTTGPALTAVLVKRLNSTPQTGGFFSKPSVLQAEYQ
jgi:hypothetical protein